MGVMTVRIDDKKRKLLKIISSIEGKPMGRIVGELIEEYINKNREKLLSISNDGEIQGLMKLSEDSFSEWNNIEDEIYDSL